MTSARKGRRCRKCGLAKPAGRCSGCRNAYLKAWRSTHSGYMSIYYARNRERLLQEARSYYWENKKKINERNRRNHIAALIKRGDEVRTKRRIRQKANPEKTRERVRRRRARLAGAEGSFTMEQWQDVVLRQRGKCARCRRATRLTADHIIPLVLGGSSYIHNIQGLCSNCNSKKSGTISAGSQLGIFDRVHLFLSR